MCTNPRLVNSLECYMDDLVDCFEDFVTKSLVIVSLAIGAVIVMIGYVLKMLNDRNLIQIPTSHHSRPILPDPGLHTNATILNYTTSTQSATDASSISDSHFQNIYNENILNSRIHRQMVLSVEPGLVPVFLTLMKESWGILVYLVIRKPNSVRQGSHLKRLLEAYNETDDCLFSELQQTKYKTTGCFFQSPPTQYANMYSKSSSLHTPAVLPVHTEENFLLLLVL
ncbi:hypothetical protein evm_003769 [Chilo suppressalis]|nr:hypothetical protein evm_003769 [Chilo suppressalis]